VIRSTLAFTIPDPDFLPENLAYDPHDGAFYLGSLAKRVLVRRSPDGRLTTLAGPAHGLLRVVGMKLDAARRQLWVATWAPADTASPNPSARVTRTRLFQYDLAADRLVGRYEPRDLVHEHLLNDLVVTAAGAVYLTDTADGAVYRVRAGGDTLERVVAPEPTRFSYPNGIALSRDERRLYVAYVQGIAVVDLPAGRVAYLTTPPDVSTAQIDGLYAWRGSLVAVQTAPTLERVVRFDLDAAGTRVERAVVLERGHPAFQQPTTGVIVDDDLYYIANSQWGRLGDLGALVPSADARPTAVLRLRLADR